MSTLFSSGERGSACRDVSDRADADREIAARPRFIDRLHYLTRAWAKNRGAVAEMAHRIEQLRNDNRALESELVALTIKEAASSHRSNHDALTGLPNHTL